MMEKSKAGKQPLIGFGVHPMTHEICRGSRPAARRFPSTASVIRAPGRAPLQLWVFRLCLEIVLSSSMIC